MDRTRRILGVDQLDVKQREQEHDEAVTSFGPGKYITDNVYIEAEQGLGAESGKVSVEMQLTPNLSVESEVGRDLRGGVGANWRWDY